MIKQSHPNRWMITILSFYFYLMVGVASAQEKVIIKTFNKNSCYKLNEIIEVYGTGFGDNKKSLRSKKLVIISSGKPIIINSIKQWGKEKIVAVLPTTITAIADKYVVGITQNSKWVSNRDRTIMLCRNKLPTASSALIRKPGVEHSSTLITDLPKVTKPEKRLPGATRPKTAILSIEPRIAPNDVEFARGEFPRVTDNESYDNSQYYGQRGSGTLSGLGEPPKTSAIFTGDDKGKKQEQPQEPKEAIVATTSMEEAAALAVFLKKYNISVKRRSGYPHLGVVVSVLRIPEELETAMTIQQLREINSNLWIDFNHRYELLDSKSLNASMPDPKQWAYHNVDFSRIITCEPSVKSPPNKIGVIDTSVAAKAPLNQALINRQSFLPNGTQAANADHGTAIASLLLGSPEHSIPGLVPNALLYSAAIFRLRDNKIIDTTSELIIKALNWLTAENIKTINMSFGGPKNLLVELILNRLIKNGFTIVSAAGIDKNNKPLYPAAQKGVISVRALDANNKVFSKKIEGDYIDFSAPGVDLWVINAKGNAKYQSGSSYATPFVTASMSFFNKDKNAYKQLKKTAKDLGDKGRDNFFGWGLIKLPNSC